MNATESLEPMDLDRGAAKWLTKQVVGLTIFGAILFGCAGRLDWANAWVLLGVYVVLLVTHRLVLPKAMRAERSEAQAGSRTWDIVLASVTAVWLQLATLIVAGLDARNGWSPPLPLWFLIIGVIVMALAYALVTWAMVTNAFFSATIRIQQDQGHTVVTGGPYRYMRHPGYVGTILSFLALSVVLGSLWAFVPEVIAVLLLIIRTALEDRTLQTELPGYNDYTRRVRYRLLPPIW